MADSRQDGPERRRHPRTKAQIPVELHIAGQPPMRLSTEEISASGCYIETMFTMDVGTKLELVLSLPSDTLILQGVVITKYPQVGNGIEFLDMAPQARQRLANFLSRCEGAPEAGN